VSLVDQLVKIYYEEEWWHKEKLDGPNAILYHQTLLDKQRILYLADPFGELIGYVESWRLDYGQLGRIICGLPFAATEEDVNTGDIAYVANAWIRRAERHGIVYKQLRSMFFKQNFQAKFFVGEARRKKSAPFKVFTRQEAFSKWIKEEGVTSGKREADYK
jgi:hypothetical protein